MQNRIEKRFQTLKKENKTGFIAYITAGDPQMEITEKLILKMEKAGVDFIELGVPFSDPMADGLTNQKAAERALRNHVSLKDILDSVRHVRKHTGIPVILFTYLNPVFKYGYERFAKDAHHCGVDGILVLDLLPEDGEEIDFHLKKYNISRIYLIAPTTKEERIKMITRKAETGFIYYVSRTGVTGTRQNLQTGINKHVHNIKKYSTIPVAIGFGISKPQHVRKLKNKVDAIVVGSAIVKRIENNIGKKDLVKKVITFIKTLTKEL